MLSRASTSSSICLVLDLAIRLAQPISISVDALLAGLTVLPDQVAFRHPGQAQAMRQDLGDGRLVP